MSEIITKAAALVEDVETENPNGAFEVILSAATLDRDGEVIDARAFDPLPDHIPFDIDHGMTVQTTIGSGQPYYADDGSLRVKGTYASTALAQEVRTLVSEGHVRTTSVTFMSADRTPDEKGVDHVTKAELLNGTFTPIPSNRQAVVLSSKSLAAITEERTVARKDTEAEALQSMHDAAVALGAACDHKHVKTDDESETAPEISDTEQSADKAAAPTAEAVEATVKSTDEGSVEFASLAALESALNEQVLGD